MSDNFEKISDHFVNDYLCHLNAEDFTLSFSSVKGHKTTNVYKLTINEFKKGSIKNFYIKESSNTENHNYNKYIEDEFNNTMHVYKYFMHSDKYDVVNPLMYYGGFNAFVMEEIKGKRFDKVIMRLILLRKYGELACLLELCKEWLSAFQAIQPLSNCDDFDMIASEKNKIYILKNSILKNSPYKDRDVHELMFEKLFACLQSLHISEKDIRIKHNDFAPWNILLDRKKLIVFDFADINIDYKYYDLFYFVHSLNKMVNKIPFTSSVLELMKKIMLKNTGIDLKTELYYTVFFHIQDIELYLRRSSEGGGLSVYYKYLYKKSLLSLKKIF